MLVLIAQHTWLSLDEYAWNHTAGSIRLQHVIWNLHSWGKSPDPRSATPGELKAGEEEELRGLLGLPTEETELEVRQTGLCLLLLVLSRMSKKCGFKGEYLFVCWVWAAPNSTCFCKETTSFAGSWQNIRLTAVDAFIIYSFGFLGIKGQM